MRPGDEVKLIDGWSDCYDELEELKKIFFEFLKRWVENDGSKLNVNKPILYERLSDEPFLKLQTKKEREQSKNSFHWKRSETHNF